MVILRFSIRVAAAHFVLLHTFWCGVAVSISAASRKFRSVKRYHPFREQWQVRAMNRGNYEQMSDESEYNTIVINNYDDLVSALSVPDRNVDWFYNEVFTVWDYSMSHAHMLKVAFFWHMFRNVGEIFNGSKI